LDIRHTSMTGLILGCWGIYELIQFKAYHTNWILKKGIQEVKKLNEIIPYWIETILNFNFKNHSNSS